jgi:hypothetical protein
VVKKELLNGILKENDTVKERNGEMGELITKPTIWHEMEGPVIGDREHYQEKSYGGLEHLREADRAIERPCKREPGNVKEGE